MLEYTGRSFRGAIVLDGKSLEMLEFHRIKEILAGYTSFTSSRELAIDLQPLSSFQEISLLLRQSAEARHLLSLEPDFSIGVVTDIREPSRMAALGKILEPQTLVEIQQTLISLRKLRRDLIKRAKDLPLLGNISAGITEMTDLERDISNCLTPTAELLDSASPKLAGVRRRLREAREHLMSRLNAIMRTPKGQRVVQEPIITEREGRYVIPIKVENRKELKGIVHDVSNTGATLFIEPWATMELGNELRELVMEERHEIERILRELSVKVGLNEASITRSIALSAEIDLALAKARYARRTHATEPLLTDSVGGKRVAENTRVLKLIKARHPLLGDKAVPLSVEIGSDFSILVITGPNMGGKTVALKTIGLLSLMAQAGLPIPAAPESSIPVFDGIFADIGDEQSIEQTLSTFSWHVGNIVRIIRSATGNSLVLLDELGTSTDPAEGSALARSLLLYLLSHRMITIATTHYNDLKVFAHATPGLENASLDFDPVTLMPNYHLTVGIPGGSNALVIASHLGLPAEIIDGARGMLSRGTQELEKMLADLAEEKERLNSLSQGLEEQKGKAEHLNAELTSKLQELKAEEKRIIREARDRIVREVAELQREVRLASAELRKARTKEGIERARTLVTRTQDKLKSEVWQPVTAGQDELDENTISAGDTVLLRDTDLVATVLSVSSETGQVEVQAGRARLTLSLDGIAKVTASPRAIGTAFTPITKELGRRSVSLELDLRGKRAEEVGALLDTYLNNASLASLGRVRIIHGFGTGTVRKIVRELLASHPLVRSFSPGERGEGGDGVTIVKL